MAFEAGTVVARLVLAGEGFAQGIRKADQATEGLRAGLDRVSGTFGRMSVAATAAFAAMSAGLVLASRKGIQFEESMINVGAVTGATSERLEELSNIAIETGEATIFSASQVGEAMFNLGSQGVKTAAQFRDVLAPSLDLAAATQTNVNFASKALLASIRAFGQPLSAATRFANVFSAANENSALTAEILDRALRPVGATASALGVDFEETTAILGGLVNAGLTAERAGTGLKTALALLLNPSKDATKQLKKLGISQKTIAKLIKNPIKLFKLFAQRGINAAQAMKIFGTEGGPAVLAITKQIPSIEKLNRSIRDTDSASRIAARQLESTAAKAKLLGSAFESAAIGLFQSLQPAINAVIFVLTDVAKKMAAFIRENKTLVGIVAITVTGLTGAVAVFTGLIAATAAAAAGVVGVAVAFQGFGKILPGVTKKMALARVGMVSLAGKLGAGGLAFTLGFILGKAINDLITNEFPNLSNAINNFIAGLPGFENTIKNQTKNLGDLNSKLQTAGKSLIELASKGFQGTAEKADNMNRVFENLGVNFDVLAIPIRKMFQDFQDGKITADELTTSLENLGVAGQTATEASKGALLLGATDEQLLKRNEFILNAIGFLNQTLGFGEKIKTQGEEENEEKDKLIDKIGQTVNLEGKFGQAIDGVLAGTRGVGESLGVLIKQIGLSIVKALVLQGIMLVIASIFGGGKGKVGLIGKVLGLSGGGVIGAQAGLLPAREDRLIGVQDGESVLNRGATAALGREGINQLNAGGAAGGNTTVQITQVFKAPLGFTREGLEMLNEANQKLRREFAGGI